MYSTLLCYMVAKIVLSLPALAGRCIVVGQFLTRWPGACTRCITPWLAHAGAMGGMVPVNNSGQAMYQPPAGPAASSTPPIMHAPGAAVAHQIAGGPHVTARWGGCWGRICVRHLFTQVRHACAMEHQR